MRRHKAVLLAAGGSQRLGRAKQELTTGGVPLIRHMAQLLVETAPQRVLVVVGIPAMARHLDGLDLDVVHNPRWRDGLSTSVQVAGRALRRNAAPVLFAAVDQCRLDLAHLQALLAQTSDDHDTVTRYDRDSFGVPAVVTPATLRRAGELQADRGFGQIWRAGRTPLAFVDAPQLAFDLDTPAELATAIRNQWIDPTSATPTRVLKHASMRQTLIDAAQALFARDGYDATSFDDIARAAGTSRRTVFRYFAGKPDIALGWMADTGEALGRAVREAPDGLAPMALLTHAFSRFAQDGRPAATMTLIAGAGTGAGELRDLSLAGFARWESILAEALKDRAIGAPVLTARCAIAILRTVFETGLEDRGRDFDTIFKTTVEAFGTIITKS